MYKNISYLLLSLILVSILATSIFYNWVQNYKNIKGELVFIGDVKILTISKNLWFKEKLQIKNNFYNLSSGDQIECSGNFRIENTDQYFLISQGIYRIIDCNGSWKNISSENLFQVINANLSKNFDKFNYDSSQLLKGITLGVKPSKELNSAFQNIGLSHIIVISGFNITLILTIVLKIFGKLKILYKAILAVILVIGFILIVGPSAPVIRAGVMGLVAFFSTIKWKNISYIRILLFSALIMSVIDPYVIYSVSFQLSFLATAGVILFTEKIEKFFYGIASIIREPLCQSIAAAIFTLPLTINTFSTFSPALFISNILILPILSFTSVLAYIYMFIPIYIIFFPLSKLTDLIVQVSLYLASFNNSKLLIGSETKNILTLIIIIFYVVLAIYVLYKLNRLYIRIEKNKRIEYYSNV